MVHHEHFIADALDDSEVVRNEEVGDPEFFLEIEEEVEDGGLDTDVEGADGFIADDEVGLRCECACDADALALTATEFVGVAVCHVWAEAYELEELGDAGSALAAGHGREMDFEGFSEGGADGEAGIEGAVGVLEDHLHAFAKGAELAFG